MVFVSFVLLVFLVFMVLVRIIQFFIFRLLQFRCKLQHLYYKIADSPWCPCELFRLRDLYARGFSCHPCAYGACGLHPILHLQTTIN
jgi:hypothetical protein